MLQIITIAASAAIICLSLANNKRLKKIQSILEDVKESLKHYESTLGDLQDIVDFNKTKIEEERIRTDAFLASKRAMYEHIQSRIESGEKKSSIAKSMGIKVSELDAEMRKIKTYLNLGECNEQSSGGCTQNEQKGISRNETDSSTKECPQN